MYYENQIMLSIVIEINSFSQTQVREFQNKLISLIDPLEQTPNSVPQFTSLIVTILNLPIRSSTDGSKTEYKVAIYDTIS